MAKHSGIFLIEDKALDRRASAGPFLKALNWCHGCQIERRQAAGANDLLHYVKDWASGSWDLGILYFWGHGSPNDFWLGEGSGDRVKLEQIGKAITDAWDFDPDDRACLIHFGACSTLRLTDDDFLRESGVAAVSGYRVDVDWIDSLAFEMLYMSRIQSVVSSVDDEDTYLTPDVMRQVWSCLDTEPTKALVDHLHFDMRIAK